MLGLRFVLLAAAGVLAVGVLLVSWENVVGSSVAIGSALGLIAIIMLLGRAVRVLIGIALVTLVVAGLVTLLSPGSSPSPPTCVPSAYFGRFQIDASYDEVRQGWSSSARMTLPAESLDAMSAPVPAGCPAGPLISPPNTPRSERASAVARLLAPEGWRLAQFRNNDPVFAREVDFAPAQVSTFPALKTTLVLPGPRVKLGGASITPSDTSVVSLTAPRGMVLATTPTSEARRVADGEVSRVELKTPVDEVDVVALSPLVRFEPLRSLMELTTSNLPGFVIAIVALLTIALGKDKITSTLGRLISRRRPTPAEDTSVDPDHEVEPAPRRARRAPHRLIKPTSPPRRRDS